MKTWISGILSIVLLILGWELLSTRSFVDPAIFPPPHEIAIRSLELLTDSNFLIRDLRSSAWRFAWALALGTPLAVFLGILCGSYPWPARFISPFINFTYPLPKVAILPLFLVIFGIDDLGKIIFIAVGAFYSVFVNTYAGTLRLRRSSLEDLVMLYNVRGKKLWWNLVFRGVAPDIVIGYKGAVAYALTLVVVSEFTVSNNGLGNFVWRAWDQFRVTDMYAGIFLLCLIGWILQEALDLLLRSILRNRPEFH